MPRATGSLITDADLSGYYPPQIGYAPSGDNSQILSGNIINSRYLVGGVASDLRCPSWNELTSSTVTINCYFAVRNGASGIGQYLYRYLNAPVNAVLTFTGSIQYQAGQNYALTVAYNLPANTTEHWMFITGGLSNLLDYYTITGVNGNPYAGATITHANIVDAVLNNRVSLVFANYASSGGTARGQFGSIWTTGYQAAGNVVNSTGSTAGGYTCSVLREAGGATVNAYLKKNGSTMQTKSAPPGVTTSFTSITTVFGDCISVELGP